MWFAIALLLRLVEIIVCTIFIGFPAYRVSVCLRASHSFVRLGTKADGLRPHVARGRPSPAASVQWSGYAAAVASRNPVHMQTASTMRVFVAQTAIPPPAGTSGCRGFCINTPSFSWTSSSSVVCPLRHDEGSRPGVSLPLVRLGAHNVRLDVLGYSSSC